MATPNGDSDSKAVSRDLSDKPPVIVTPAKEIDEVPGGWISMARFGRGRDRRSQGKLKTQSASATGSDGEQEVLSDEELLGDTRENERSSHDNNSPVSGDSGNNEINAGAVAQEEPVVYKVYKRRWFGLFQLVLLNIIVSWDWLSFAAISTSASEYFQVSTSAINWLSSSFLFSFVAITPFTIYVLHKGGPRPAIIISAVCILIGNWIRYGAAKANNFGAVMFGQILTGCAQPFVLSAPTRYSDLWFTGRGRVAATAVMSLANPFGGALAQLINPFWVNVAGDIPNMILYVGIISSVAALPSFFIPAKPPTPCCPSAAEAKQSLLPSLKYLFALPEFYMIVIPFTIYVGFFNSISSLLNQILEPYGFSETEAGIAGAILIVAGLVTSAVTSPILDRNKKYLFAIKLQVPIIAICYLAYIWAPPTRVLGASYTILAILGASSFSLVPVALEYLIEITHPISPEVTSTICWSGGQLFGGIFIQISDALTAGPNADPPYNLQHALWFQAIVSIVVMFPPLALGLFGRKKRVQMRRVEMDKRTSTRSENGIAPVDSQNTDATMTSAV